MADLRRNNSEDETMEFVAIALNDDSAFDNRSGCRIAININLCMLFNESFHMVVKSPRPRLSDLSALRRSLDENIKKEYGQS